MSSSQSERPEDLSKNVQKLLLIFSHQTKELTAVTSYTFHDAFHYTFP